MRGLTHSLLLYNLLCGDTQMAAIRSFSHNYPQKEKPGTLRIQEISPETRKKATLSGNVIETEA